jgi:hypothetical protein
MRGLHNVSIPVSRFVGRETRGPSTTPSRRSGFGRDDRKFEMLGQNSHPLAQNARRVGQPDWVVGRCEDVMSEHCGCGFLLFIWLILEWGDFRL